MLSRVVIRSQGTQFFQNSERVGILLVLDAT